MVRTKIAVLSVTVGVILGSGAAIAQMNDGVARTRGPDMEVIAAQQSLTDAIAHLKKVRDPQSQKNAGVLNLVERAQNDLRYEDGSGPPNSN